MKSKALLLLCVASLVIALLASCNIADNNGGSSNTGETEKPNANAFYSEGSSVGVCVSDSKVDTRKLDDLMNALFWHNVDVKYVEATDKSVSHKIFIGEFDNDLSKRAYTQLSRVENEDKELSTYIIYSDGVSIAIAYDHLSACEAAMDVLIDEYFNEPTLTLTSGLYERELISILDYYEEIDAENREKDWAALSNHFGDTYGPPIVAALKEYYNRHNPDVVEWFANLYDPDIGGYYFSNSGRDTPGYLPDLESTSQALGFFNSTGMASSWTAVLPDEMIKKIGLFAYNLQDPNGFFYHPQWSKELVDSKLSRRARDLGHGLGLISAAGMTPKYSSAIDQIESVDPMSDFGLTMPFGSSPAVAVSKVIATADIPHLASKEAFLNYLRGLGVYNNSYGPGNQVSSQISQIKAAGLLDVCVDYFESIQNPRNGLWEDVVDYGSINGLLKISGMWATAGRVFPYAKEAIQSVIEVIMCDVEPDGVVVMYNCWYSIRNVLNSMEFGGADETQLVKDTRETLYALAPDAIRVTADKVMLCQKPDGSFSWGVKYSSTTSQGCPVAVPNSVEGDINATVIGIGGTINNMMHALGCYSKRVPIFGKAELYRYLTTLEGLGSIVKDDTIDVGMPFDFEGSGTGSAPTDVTTNYKEGSSALVELDPVDSQNKVLHLQSLGSYDSFGGNGDTIYVPNTVGIDANCTVFTGDFYVSSNTTKTYFMQITMDKCYMLSLQVSADGKLKLIDASSASYTTAIYTTYNVDLNFDEWFNLRIEYYTGDAESVRIKAYVNDTIVCISDNFFDGSGNKFYGLVNPGTKAVETRLYCMMPAHVDMYVDNLHTYSLNKAYKADVIDDPKTPNVDAPDKDEVIYDFEEGIHEDIKILDSQYTFDKKTYNYSSESVTESEFNGSRSMLIEGGANAVKVEIPTTVRTSGANCGTLGFDLQITDADLGDFAVVKFYDKNGDSTSTNVLIGITFTCIEENGEKFLTLRQMPGGNAEATIEGVKIPLGNIINIRFEFFHAEDATLVFVDDVSAGASYALYTGGHKFTLGCASIETKHGVESKIQIDNLKCERIMRTYASATAPNVDRETYKYDDMKGVVAEGSVGIKKVGDDNVLSIGNGGKAIIPVNHRSPVVSLTTLETALSFSAIPNGSTFDLTFVDENGNEIFGLNMKGENNLMIMRERTKYGVSSNVLARFALDTEYIIKLEICPSEHTANVYINGVAIYVTNVFYDESLLGEKMIHAVLQSNGCAAYVDDTYLEAVNTVFVQAKVEDDGNAEDSASLYTFEYSTATNLPSKVTRSLASSGAALRIKSMMRDGSLTNVLEFTTTTGANDSLTFANMSTESNSNCIAFEADMKLDFAYSEKNGASCFQFRMDSGYMLNIDITKDGMLSLGDCSDSGGSGRKWGSYPATGIAHDEWFNLRIEYYPGDKDNVRIKVYLNGELLGVSNNYFGYRSGLETVAEPKQDVSKAFFYALSAANGRVFVDNVKVEKIVKPVGDDELTINIPH